MTEVDKPPRAVGTLGATLMSVNGMIGAGIFALPALLHAEVGAFAPWLFLIFGAFYSCTILVAARLATMFDQSGGPQLYVQAAFGPVLGFQVGWLLVIGAASGRAATLYVLISYLAVFFPALNGAVARQVAVLFILCALAGLTLTGMRNAVGGLVLGTVLKVTPIVLVCLVALASGGFAIDLRLPKVDAFGSVALLVYFAFSGTATATYSAGEIRAPEKTVPRAMLLSLAVIVLFYMIVQWAFIAAGAPTSAGNATPLAAAAEVLLGPVGVIALTLAAVFSIATNALTYFIVAPRVIYGMAERGLLPASLSHVSHRFLTPDRAILLFTAIVALMTFSNTFTLLASMMSLASQIWTLCMFAAFWKLQMSGKAERSHAFMATWGLILAIGTCFALYASAQAPARTFALLGGLVALGMVLFLLARRANGQSGHLQ